MYEKGLRGGALNSESVLQRPFKEVNDTMARQKTKVKKQKYKKSIVIQSYVALLPQIIGFFVFSIYPIYWILQYSFTDYDGYRVAHFVGWQNYIELFTQDRAFWASVGNTVILTVMKLVMELPLAFILAMLLCSKSLKARRLFNSLLFLPTVISVTAAGMLFSYLFRTYNGFINNLLMDIGIIGSPVSWLAEKWTALFVIALMSTWMTFPINMMFFCGAIAGVPDEVYESAKLDGCGSVRRIFSITLPMIAPTFKVILMLALTGTVKIINEVMVLTNGGPSGQTNVVMLYLYNIFFGYDLTSGAGEIGYASAGSIVTTVLIGILTIFYLKFTKKADELY